MKRFYQMGLIVAVISVLSLVSCGVHSKYSYLKEFKSFVKASMTRGAKFIEKNFNDAMQQASGLLDGLFEENEDEE